MIVIPQSNNRLINNLHKRKPKLQQNDHKTTKIKKNCIN